MLGQRELDGSRLQSMTQLQVVRRSSRIQRFEGALRIRLRWGAQRLMAGRGVRRPKPWMEGSQQLQAEMVRAGEELQAPMEEARRLQAGWRSSLGLELDVGSSSAPGSDGGNMMAQCCGS